MLQISPTQGLLNCYNEGKHDTSPKNCKYCDKVTINGTSCIRLCSSCVAMKNKKSTFNKTKINKHTRDTNKHATVRKVLIIKCNHE